MIDSIQTPLFVMERSRLEVNLANLSLLQSRTGIKILHTLKSFHAIEGLGMIAAHLSGFSVGNLHEFDTVSTLKYGHIHSYAPAFRAGTIEALAQQSDTMSFNSLKEWERYASIAARSCSVGLRINAKLTLKQPRYCDPNRTIRLGVPSEALLQEMRDNPASFEHLEGLHFHLFCSQNLDNFKYLLAIIEKKFREILPRIKWLNLGGGHRLTDSEYDREGFIALIEAFHAHYPQLALFIEPGESVVKNTGYFVTTILDIIPGEIPVVILDTSIETHLLDIAITRQKPTVRHSVSHETLHHYQLSGMSCIAGDIIGDYYFDRSLSVGERIIFEDMMGYTMVKQTEFNGIEKAAFRVI